MAIKVGALYQYHQNLLEKQIITSHPRPTESGTLRVGPSIFILISLLGDSDVHASLRTSGLTKRELRGKNHPSFPYVSKGLNTGEIQLTESSPQVVYPSQVLMNGINWPNGERFWLETGKELPV